MILLDDLDDALLGRIDTDTGRSLAYSHEQIVAILMERDEMSREDAEEYFDFNILPLEGMPHGPVFVYRHHADLDIT